MARARGAAGAESLPPPPTAYFNDYASLVSAADAARLEDKLRRFADETSTQVVVAVFESLPSESLEDFTIRAAQAWGAGRKDWDNGAVLFVFVSDRKMRIETGYGLEGALPDQLAARILDGEVRPRFRAGDWAGGLEAGIDGIIAATRGEYKAPPRSKERAGVPLVALLIILVLRGAARLAGEPGRPPRLDRPNLQPPRPAPRQQPLGRRLLERRGRGRGLWGLRRGRRRRLFGRRRLLRRRRRLEQLVRRIE